jgi:hypothetical protein
VAGLLELRAALLWHTITLLALVAVDVVDLPPRRSHNRTERFLQQLINELI